MTAPVLTAVEAGTLRITLNRPEKLNAFNPEVHRLLADALAQAESDPAVRCVLLTGAGRGFCAGQDLTERDMRATAAPADLGETIEKYYNPLIMRMQALEKPVVCAVNGVAAGAGASIALACDVVVAAKSASFIQAFVKIGLVPDSGATYFLPRMAGTARAMALAMTGERIAAQDAADWGLIWKCVADEALMTEAQALARGLAGGPTRALGLIKRAIHASGGNGLAAQLQLERELQREVGRGADYREGVSAFLEKRKPAFKGS